MGEINNMRPLSWLSWGGGGAQTEKIPDLYIVKGIIG